MSTIKVIITGATGMVGEGVLFECLRNDKVDEVLIVSRRHYEMQHPKLKELVVPDDSSEKSRMMWSRVKGKTGNQ